MRRGELDELLGEETWRARRHQHELGHTGEIAVVERQIIPGFLHGHARAHLPFIGQAQGVVDRERRGDLCLGGRVDVIDPLAQGVGGPGRRRFDVAERVGRGGNNLLGITVAGINRDRGRGRRGVRDRGVADERAGRQGHGVPAPIGLVPLHRVDRVEVAIDRGHAHHRAVDRDGRGLGGVSRAVDIGQTHGVDHDHGIVGRDRSKQVGGTAQADPEILRAALGRRGRSRSGARGREQRYFPLVVLRRVVRAGVVPGIPGNTPG